MADETRVVVRNETPKRLWLRGAAGRVLVLPPFGERVLSAVERAAFDLDALVLANLITFRRAERSDLDDHLTAALTLALLYVLLGLVVPFGPIEWAIGGALMLAAMAGVALWRFKSIVRPWFVQQVSFLMIVIIGVLLPAAVIMGFATAEAGVGILQFTSLPPPVLIGSSLQLLFISSASLLPALLYYLFDRMQLSTLRRRFLHEVFRLDPAVHTLSDVNAKYGDRLDEAYGPEDAASTKRFGRGNRLPILVCTLVLTMGWLLTLPPVSGVAARGIDSAAAILRLVTPTSDPLTFAFLGAYLFGITMILRRYVRGDLKPKAYSSVTVRIFVTIILAWVMRIAIPIFEQETVAETVAAAAAMAEGTTGVGAGLEGIAEALLLIVVFVGASVPETLLAYLQEVMRGRLRMKHQPGVEERQPLTDIEGIDLYDRARLMDEGVINVESLAHHDIPELIFNTRIPVARIVDWVDQSILYLHTDAATRMALRACGVRTATDLERAMLGADDKLDPRAANQLARLLQPNGDRAQLQASRSRLEVALRALHDDEWLDHVRHWRASGVGVEVIALEAVPDQRVRAFRAIGARDSYSAALLPLLPAEPLPEAGDAISPS